MVVHSVPFSIPRWEEMPVSGCFQSNANDSALSENAEEESQLSGCSATSSAAVFGFQIPVRRIPYVWP